MISSAYVNTDKLVDTVIRPCILPVCQKSKVFSSPEPKAYVRYEYVNGLASVIVCSNFQKVYIYL